MYKISSDDSSSAGAHTTEIASLLWLAMLQLMGADGTSCSEGLE
jgi:hypothetical protein